MSYYRPSEVPALIGHSSKVKLGWESSTSLEAMSRKCRTFIEKWPFRYRYKSGDRVAALVPESEP
jgi:hypothetical protein